MLFLNICRHSIDICIFNNYVDSGGGNIMVQNFWRVRLGAAKKGVNRFEKVFDLCKNEDPPCIAVGWGEIDLTQDIKDISIDYEFEYDEPFKGKFQIKRWVDMKEKDLVIAMIRPATICAIGKIIKKHYKYDDKKFEVEIEGYNNPGEVLFFNRIDVKWIFEPDEYIKVKSLGLPKRIENILLQRVTIIEIERNDYNSIKEKIDIFEPEKKSLSPKYNRKYDHQGKSGR